MTEHNFNNIKLHKLKFEWSNFFDHSAQQEIAKRNSWRKEAGNAPLDLEECAWWRHHFRRTREEFIRLSALPWTDVFMQVIATDGIQRHADHPTWIAANLRLLDTRPIHYTCLERAIGISQGHTYRTLSERGGVEWKVMKDGETPAREEQEVSFDLRHYPVPRQGVILSRGKVHRTDDLRVLELPLDSRPTLPRPPQHSSLGKWWTTKRLATTSDARPTRAEFERSLSGLGARLNEDHIERISKLAADEGVVRW